jgi:mutator protein MutT
MKSDRPKKPLLQTVNQTSAGGVAIRADDSKIEVAIIQTATEKRWQLPKGIVDPGETPDQAALREVREEAGINCEIISKLDTIEYWFVASYDGEKKRYHKNVHFFLMKYLNGDVADHDREVAEARWVAINEAVEMLVFASERKLVEKAKSSVET